MWFQIINNNNNPKQKIKQFYLTHRWDHNRYYHSGQSGPESNGNEGVLHIPQASGLKYHHQM